MSFCNEIEPRGGAVGVALQVTVALSDLPLPFPSSSFRLWRSAERHLNAAENPGAAKLKRRYVQLVLEGEAALGSIILRRDQSANGRALPRGALAC